MRKFRQVVTLLPSCGVAVAELGVEVIPTCTEVVVDDATPEEGQTVTATATLYKQEGFSWVPLANETLHYRVINAQEQILAEGSKTTDGSGQITFDYKIDDVGAYMFLASFFGKNPELPDTIERWRGCVLDRCVSVPGGGPITPGPAPGPVLPPSISPGGTTIDRRFGQKPCGILCGQSMNKIKKMNQTDGLEPK